MKHISKSFWFSLVPSMILMTSAIILLVINVIPLYYLWTTLVMWILVSGLGIAVGYHRVFSHKTHSLPRWKENIILFFAIFAGQGSSIFWAALHRGYHHPYADSERDIHSPIHGKWHAFVGWWITITERDPRISMKYAVDLLKKSNHIWVHENYFKVFWAVPILICFIDWKLAFTGFWLVTGISLLQDNLVNLYGHTKGYLGYRNFDTNDSSHNHPILGYITWGQGWHNNHHYDPKSFDFGKSISGKWWEWDPSTIFLKML